MQFEDICKGKNVKQLKNMETNNEHGFVAQAATLPNHKDVNQISDGEGSLLDLMVRYGIRDLEQRRLRSQLLETAFKFETTPEWVKYMKDHGWIFTNIGTIEMESNLVRDQYYISMVKMRMRFRIGKAIQKLMERITEIVVSHSYLQIFKDEGVSLYILPESFEAPRELYKYGNCTGAVIQIERLQCDLKGLIDTKMFGYEDLINEVGFGLNEFRLVDDTHLVPSFDYSKEDYDECFVTLAEIRKLRAERGLTNSNFDWIK